MKKFALISITFLLISCWKNNKETDEVFIEDQTPIDTTIVDSVVGQASFSAINAAIENAGKPKDSVKILTKEEKLAQEIAEKEKLLKEKKDKEKLENDKKLKAKIETPKSVETPKPIEEKKVDELIETPKNK